MLSSSSKNKYQKVGDQSEHGDIELATNAEESESTVETTTFVLKVLYKEATETLDTLSTASTVAELKTVIENKFSIPSARQRLIYAGKVLKPDEKHLSDFRIANNATIHLFPIPVPTSESLSVAVPVGSNSSTHNPLYPTAQPYNNNNNYNGPPHNTLYLDPFFNQTHREVRLWCMTLIILSGMTLFNNLSYMMQTGRLGMGWFDGVVTIVDTLCSVGGLYVGQLGINSLRTLNLEDIKVYVKWLGALGAVSVIMRIAWVLDVILQVKKAIHDQNNDNTDNTNSVSGNNNNNNGNGNNNNGDDLDNTNGQKMNESMITTFSIQVILIALIIILSWASCFIRAVRLQTAVEQYRVNTQEPVPAVVQQV